MSSPTGPTRRPGSSSANMSISPMLSTPTRKPGWSMACSLALPANYAPANGQYPVAPAKPPDEFTLIARYFRPLTAGSPGALDLCDDAALLDLPEGRRLVVSADALVAGVHFFPEDAPDLIARKML